MIQYWGIVSVATLKSQSIMHECCIFLYYIWRTDSRFSLMLQHEQHFSSWYTKQALLFYFWSHYLISTPSFNVVFSFNDPNKRIFSCWYSISAHPCGIIEPYAPTCTCMYTTFLLLFSLCQRAIGSTASLLFSFSSLDPNTLPATLLFCFKSLHFNAAQQLATIFLFPI